MSPVHQSARPPHRATRRHRRIPERRLQLLQRRHAFHQPPRRPRDPICVSRTLTPTPSTMVRMPWSRDNPPPCRIPTIPAPSADPASPTSASAWSPRSPSSLARFIAGTSFWDMPSTIGRSRRSSTTAAGVRSAPPSPAIPTRTATTSTTVCPATAATPSPDPTTPPPTSAWARPWPSHERYKLNLIAESFNMFNRDNQRVAITSNGTGLHRQHVRPKLRHANVAPYPGYYELARPLHQAQRRLRSPANPASPEVHILRAQECLQSLTCHPDRTFDLPEGKGNEVEGPAFVTAQPSQNDPNSHFGPGSCTYFPLLYLTCGQILVITIRSIRTGLGVCQFGRS